MLGTREYFGNSSIPSVFPRCPLRLLRVVFGSVFLLTGMAAGDGHSAVIVRPEQAVYYVTPGQTFDLRIHVDANDSTLGNTFEPLANGLFSFGVQARFPIGSVNLPALGQVSPASPLNFFGLTTGALKQVTSMSASAKGNIDPGSGSPYLDSLLLTIQLTNLVQPSGSYLVELDEWRTLGASEQIFVTGSGSVLDTSPSSNLFLPALIIVVPEPSSFSLLMVPVVGAIRSRRHRRICRVLKADN